MADQKISQLDADAAPTGDDLVVTVHDPGGGPVNRKVPLSDLAASAPFSGTYAAIAPAGSSGYGLVVEHGATASTARPVFDGVVLWVGTVEPDNLVAGDVVVRDISGSVLFDTHTRTGGDVAFVTTSYVDVSSLGVEVTVSVGDVVAFYLNTKWKGAEAADGRLNLYSVNRAAVLATGAGGIVAWQGPASMEMPIGAAYFYTIQAADISGGTASFVLQGKVVVGTGPRSIKSTASDPLTLSAQVL